MKKWQIALMWLLPIVVAVVSLGIGRFYVDPITIVKIFTSQVFPIDQTWSNMEETVVMNVRFPRILLALLIGGGLAMAGASFQGMFGNPLVSPDILGVSAGAGFGASLGILLFGQGVTAQLLALVFGLLAILFTFFVAGNRKNAAIYMFVLAGVITSALFNALISLTKFVADPEEKLPAITYWLMGSLGTATYRDLSIAGPIILFGMLILYVLRWRLNLLTLPEDEAKSMGIPVTALKWAVIAGATIITAATVAAAGIVGWVGLIIPHVARMFVGNNNQFVLPVSLAIGSVYLLIIDDLARSLTATEIPLSILTAIIGAPFFAYLLRRMGGRWV
ncbi:iron ABC transporter permease [Kurthia sp. 3B1D]|uniref:Iron ABC transporter permease n=1 Tax=Candidatus Kurthia intestinigallinarum TaxID=1562256 RepID=A0A433RXU3_9BACL|nr:iron ABC transporter permease [Kurthia sp. 3B1D]RUS58087.1 iron ABC transporter permease [Kurthia sp. 3B1D]